jgi:O-antigen ligase
VVVLEGAIIGVAVIGYFVLPDLFTSLGDSRPGFLFDRVMGSPSAHSNTLSSSGALVTAYALAAFFRSQVRSEKVQWMVWSIVGTLSMLLASGRQGLVIWLVAVAVLLWVHRRRVFIVVIAPLTALVLAANWDVLWAAITRNQSSETLATLSSRFVWWGAAIEAWEIHPFTGYGYGVGGRFAALRGITNTAGVHNGYLEALVGLGLIGTLLLLIVVARVGMWAVPRLRKGMDTTAPILIIPLVLHTAVSLGFGGWLNADFLLFAFLAALSDNAYRERRSLMRSPPDTVVVQ